MTDKQLLKKLGMRIKQLRLEKGLSQSDFGIEIEMEKSNVSRLEAGTINPRIYTLYKVSKSLDVSLSELLTFE